MPISTRPTAPQRQATLQQMDDEIRSHVVASADSEEEEERNGKSETGVGGDPTTLAAALGLAPSHHEACARASARARRASGNRRLSVDL